MPVCGLLLLPVLLIALIFNKISQSDGKINKKTGGKPLIPAFLLQFRPQQRAVPPQSFILRRDRQRLLGADECALRLPRAVIGEREQVVGVASPGEGLADVGARPLRDRERTVYHKNNAIPVLLRVEQVCEFKVRLAQVRRFGNGAVHEVLEYTGEGTEQFVDAEGVQLDHHPDLGKSRGQYLPLLELAVREEPGNDRNRHYLGREYMFRGEWERAVAVLKEHLAMPRAVWRDERCASMRYIARCLRQLGRDEEAALWLHRAVAEAPYLREPYLEFADLLYAQKNWYGVIFMVNRALTITERPRTYICEPFAWGSYPYDLLSLAYDRTGQTQRALSCAEKALSLTPQDERLQKNCALLQKKLQEEGRI